MDSVSATSGLSTQTAAASFISHTGISKLIVRLEGEMIRCHFDGTSLGWNRATERAFVDRFIPQRFRGMLDRVYQ